MDKFIEVLIKLSDKAESIGDIPVGAIVVKGNKIIGKGYINRIKSKRVISHAEVNAIIDASKKLNDWRLNDCDLYVTLEPCDMCYEIIKQSRIKNVYYLLENKEKHKYNKTNVHILKYNEETVNLYRKKLSNFFAKNLNR